MSTTETAITLLQQMLNPFLFLAAGFIWVLLRPRQPGCWLLLTGGILMFTDKALQYSDAGAQLVSRSASDELHQLSITLAPAMVGLGILLIAINMLRHPVRP
ncbi:MAG: hypothetical protein ACRBC3_09215 [Burkholderiaceae bacterium]